MRIDKTKYRIFTDHILYEVYEDINAQLAIQDAFEIMRFENLPVTMVYKGKTINITKKMTHTSALITVLQELRKSKIR